MISDQTQSRSHSPNKFIALVVTNDSASRLHLRGLIESEGGQVIEAHDSADALIIFANCRPDIILMDTTMLERDGFDAYELIQALPHGPDTPVLIVTALDDEAAVDHVLALGAADYVTKPIRPTVLRHRMHRLLKVHTTDVAILRAKKEWEAAFDAVSDIVILTDLSGKIIRCNLAAIQHLQTTYLQLIGRELQSVLWKDNGQKFQLPFGEPGELQLPSLPGWFEARTFPGRMEGRQQTIVYIFKDITERKQAELKLRQLSQAVEQSPISIVITDASGTIEYVNPCFTRLTGYTFEEAVGKNPRLLRSDQTRPEIHAQLWDTITSGREWHGEFINIKKNGDVFVERASISPVVDATGTITHFLAWKEDITERTRAKEMIKGEQERTQMILESITLPMIISRVSDHRVVYANPAFAQFRGLALEDLIGSQTFNFFVNPEDWGRMAEILKDGGYANDFETQLRHPDGKIARVLLSSRVFNYQNEICVLTTLVDTNRRGATSGNDVHDKVSGKTSQAVFSGFDKCIRSLPGYCSPHC